MGISFNGKTVTVNWQASDGATGLNVAAKLYDVTSVQALVSTIPMTDAGEGSYFAQFTPNGSKNYLVRTRAYTDPGTWAVPNDNYSAGLDGWDANDLLNQIKNLITPVEIIGAVLDGTALQDNACGGGCQNPYGLAVINQGTVRQIAIALNSQKTKLPFDISSATQIILAFLNTDGTTLEKKMTLGDVSIINGGGGILSAALTSADTAGLLQTGNLNFGTMILKLTIGGQDIIVNLFNSIQVIAQPFAIT